MKRITFSIFLLLASGASSFAEKGDSTQNVNLNPAYNLKLATRFHSQGQFAYGGRIVSDNPVVDLNFTYDRKNWGLQVFKAIDIKDPQTPINFTLAVVNKNFHFGKRLTVTPSAGFILEQNKTVADHGTDVAFIVTTTYKISKVFTVDHSALFGNLVLVPEEKDWVNRIRLTYSKKHLDLFGTVWHNNKVFDTSEYFTLGLGAFYSRMKAMNHMWLSAGVSALVMPYSNQPEEYPKKNGLIFTLAVIID